MKRNGWNINVQYNKETTDRNYEKCKAGEWRGYRNANNGNSYISATFKGYGNATLSYGNCEASGTVKVSLNNEELHNATGDDLAAKVTFQFGKSAKSDELKVEGFEGGMILLHALDIACNNGANMHSKAALEPYGSQDKTVFKL